MQSPPRIEIGDGWLDHAAYKASAGHLVVHRSLQVHRAPLDTGAKIDAGVPLVGLARLTRHAELPVASASVSCIAVDTDFAPAAKVRIPVMQDLDGVGIAGLLGGMIGSKFDLRIPSKTVQHAAETNTNHKMSEVMRTSEVHRQR